MIEDDKFIEEKILPYLTKEICILLNKNKDELKEVIWHDNESNVDIGFSMICVLRLSAASLVFVTSSGCLLVLFWRPWASLVLFWAPPARPWAPQGPLPQKR